MVAKDTKKIGSRLTKSTPYYILVPNDSLYTTVSKVVLCASANLVSLC